jgi:cell division protein FtsN
MGSGGVGTEPAAAPKSDPAAPSPGTSATDSSATRAAELLGGNATPGAQPDTAVSAKPGAAPLQYYVQIGAYTRSEDAEQQRAKLAMSGLSARVTERDQGGRAMYRVRLGPFNVREDAENARDQAATSGYPDATLMPVQR